VRRGIPFRESHEVVAKAVNLASKKGIDISELTVNELQKISDLIDEELINSLSLEASVASRDHVGGTAADTVLTAIKKAQDTISKYKSKT
jgi:argininosuccinate lyase